MTTTHTATAVHHSETQPAASAPPGEAAPVVLTTLENLTQSMAEAAQLELSLQRAAASCKASVERIKLLHDEETAAPAARLQSLTAAIIAYVKQHRAVLMPGKKSFRVLEHEVKVREPGFATCDNEAAVIALLEDEAKHGANEAQKEASEACLRRPPVELDKEFVHKHWDKYADWFRSVGLRIEKGEQWSLKFNFAPEKK